MIFPKVLNNGDSFSKVSDATLSNGCLLPSNLPPHPFPKHEPSEGLFICESEKVIRRALSAGYEPCSFLAETGRLTGEGSDILAKYADSLPVYIADEKTLRSLTGYALTGGMLCAMERKPLPPAEDLCKDLTKLAVLVNIENPTNVGAIFRSAAALGMDGVLLAGGSADPLYRRAARVSMGTVFQIPWTVTEDVPFRLLKSLGFATAAMALSDKSTSKDDPAFLKETKKAVILGNEGDGLPEDTIHKSDYIIKIPMARGVDSLNVAAASAVAFWSIR